MSNETDIHADCDAADCVVSPNRRQFLRDTFLSVAGALVAVGMNKATALAMPLDFTAATRSRGNRHSYAIPSVDGAQVDKDNEVILVRWQDGLYAFSLSCPHQNTALKWSASDHRFQCPKHHSEFTPDGTYVPDSGRATRNMDRFAITRDGGGVSVDLDKLYQEDTDGPQWAAAVVKLK
jgi:nitrite reductase/ring-hydroxylating ferredoxin subunit